MNKKENKILEIFQKIAAKRFSDRERIVLIAVIIVLAAVGNHFLGIWIDEQKKRTTVISPIIPPDKLILPKPVYKKNADSDQEAVEITPAQPALRDPFLSSKDPDKLKQITEKKPQIDLTLSGVLWDDQVPTAIINSKVVNIGDLIGTKTVVDIEKDQVVLMEEGQIFILKLRKK